MFISPYDQETGSANSSFNQDIRKKNKKRHYSLLKTFYFFEVTAIFVTAIRFPFTRTMNSSFIWSRLSIDTMTLNEAILSTLGGGDTNFLWVTFYGKNDNYYNKNDNNRKKYRCFHDIFGNCN